ncbi:MAG: isocitrate/isopropylmalate dehydrogenase family protein [Candidatus Helarchaeota archaeon]|nr:isocitrate/isopropylmalate dehydrogenase family protein [Candidatus Helarchaeota archaeon]
MKKICLIGGEGIGIEVIDSAHQVLNELSLPNTEIIEAFAGEIAEKKFGNAFPQETKAAIDDSNAILFGATQNKAVGTLMYLRFGLDNFANIRPVKLYKGLKTPIKDVKNIDFIIIRENLEGLYAVIKIGEGNIKKLVKKGILREEDYTDFFHRSKGYYATKIITEYESKRVAKLACEKTVERKTLGFPGRLSIVHKANVMMLTDGLFKKVAYSMAKDYIKKHKIRIDDYHVDIMSANLIRYPETFDIILAVNEYGDILSDLGAELVGGMGIAPSACIGSDHPYFEPVHGSAPDIAGKGIANPLAAILSLKMLLEYLKYKEVELLDKVIEEYFLQVADPAKNWKCLPPDLVPKIYREQNKFAKTKNVTQNIIEKIKK